MTQYPTGTSEYVPIEPKTATLETMRLHVMQTIETPAFVSKMPTRLLQRAQVSVQLNDPVGLMSVCADLKECLK
jgi:hypothetical protein